MCVCVCTCACVYLCMSVCLCVYDNCFSYGDLRVEMSQHVSTTWLALGTYKIQFIPKIIVTILEMSLVKQKGALTY